MRMVLEGAATLSASGRTGDVAGGGWGHTRWTAGDTAQGAEPAPLFTHALWVRWQYPLLRIMSPPTRGPSPQQMRGSSGLMTLTAAHI